MTSFPALAAGVEVIASWGHAPTVVADALGLASLPRAVGITQATPSNSPAPQRPRPRRTRRRRRSSALGIYRGRGFDVCTAPSSSDMSAWSSSPYRAIGIYIGGVNSACAQPNLTAAWVRREIARGWRLFSYYVGPQAPGTNCGGCVIINGSRASAEGVAAANDAVRRARALGMAPGSPIYYDLEGHAETAEIRATVLSFARAWTRQLHLHGYTSGFYGSAFSTMRDLVSAYGTRFPEPDDISIAAWNGQRTTSDSSVPSRDWADHQRLHQYEGGHNETYGHVTLNIDDDALNGAVAYKRPAHGYLVLTSDGAVRPFGGAAWHGSDAGKLGNVKAIALARDRHTGGYWILKSDGGIDSFHAPWDGSLKHKLRGQRPTALAAGPRGGYLVLTSNGAVYPFGPAVSQGSDSGVLPTGVTALSLAVDRTTGGYWILRSDGGVDAFGAPSYGSLEGKLHGAKPAALATTWRGGYLILTTHGAVHAFGPAVAVGSDGGRLPTRTSAVALATRPGAAGYWILRSDGGVDGFRAPWYGSLMGTLPVGQRPAAVVAADP